MDRSANCKGVYTFRAENNDTTLISLATVVNLQAFVRLTWKGERVERVNHLLYFQLDELQRPLEVGHLSGSLFPIGTWG
jgi:hypothetical protein